MLSKSNGCVLQVITVYYRSGHLHQNRGLISDIDYGTTAVIVILMNNTTNFV